MHILKSGMFILELNKVIDSNGLIHSYTDIIWM
jgi:hypothetical protein